MSDRYPHGNLRERLIEEAVIFLSDGGIEKLSLHALASKIGVSHAVPFRHFPTKHDQFYAIALSGVERLLTMTAHALKHRRLKRHHDDALNTAPDNARLLNMALVYVR